MNKIGTMKDFISKLEIGGMSDYASELRAIVAMSRKRRDAVSALSNMTLTLLTHLIKYIKIPQSRDRNKWHKEIKGYLYGFDTWNKSPKRRPWLSIDYIQETLTDVLVSPDFLNYLDNQLEGYSEKSAILKWLKGRQTLKSLGVKPSFDANNNLTISINGHIL